MKNDSVKFKRNVPKSSTNSAISDFEQSPQPNPNLLTFGHAMNNHLSGIQARLSRNSVISENNLRYSQPKCYPPMAFIERDEVLAKSPLMRSFTPTVGNYGTFSEAVQQQNSRYTSETVNRVERFEMFLSKHVYNQEKPGLLTDLNTPKVSDHRLDHLIKVQADQAIEVESDVALEQQEAQQKFNQKLQKHLDKLRIVRQVVLISISKHPIYFESYDGTFAMKHDPQQMFLPYQNDQNGVVVCCGNYLQSITLETDTFRNQKICQVLIHIKKNKKNPETCNYSALCLPDQHFNDWIISGSESGTVLAWHYQRPEKAYLHQVSHQTHLLDIEPLEYLRRDRKHGTEFHIHTVQLLQVLDPRMKEKKSVELYDGNEVSPLKTPAVSIQHQFSMDSPKKSDVPIEYFKESNIAFGTIEEEPDSALQGSSTQTNGIRYIDVLDNYVLATIGIGFTYFDLRQPDEALFNYINPQSDAIKALFKYQVRKIIKSGTSSNIIFADRNSHSLKMWNLDQDDLSINRDMPSNPLDVIVAPQTREILTLLDRSQIMIYDADHSKLKFIDQLQLENHPLKKLHLDSTGQILYGFGAYSLRAWKYYNAKETELLEEKIMALVRQQRQS